MNVALGVVLGVVGVVAALESAVRLYRWRLAPTRLRLLYASFLLNEEAVHAITEIHQRAERAGARSFDDLFALYTAASGRSRSEIEALFGFRMSWRRLRTSKLVLRNQLRWHVGLVPIPGQRLRTATIAGDGTRSNGPAGTAPRDVPVRQVALTGGSVAYGYGATSDEATIAARLCHYLNRRDPRPTHRWDVVNHAFPAATSFQELIAALQWSDSAAPPAYVVSLSGCNDVDQQFARGEANVSSLAQAYTNGLRRQGVLDAVRRAARSRMVLLSVAGRLAAAYRQWPGSATAHPDGRGRAARSAPREIDKPDIYPLW